MSSLISALFVPIFPSTPGTDIGWPRLLSPSAALIWHEALTENLRRLQILFPDPPSSIESSLELIESANDIRLA